MFNGDWSHISLRYLRFLTALAPAALLGLEAAHAGSYTNVGAFGANDKSIWSSGNAYVLNTGNQFAGIAWDYGKTAGSKSCLGDACVGAIIGAETSGRFGFDYGLKVNSGSYDIKYPFQMTFTTPNSYVGDNIGNLTIGSAFSGSAAGSALQVNGPTFEAYLDLAAKYHAFAGAEVCVGVCVGPAVGFDFDASHSLVAINKNGDGKLVLYGQEVIGGQSSSALGGFLHGSLNLPDFDSSSAATPGGFANNVLTSTSRSQVMSLTADLAKIAVETGAVPFSLTGEEGGFGYTLIDMQAGLGIDLQQTLKFTPEFKGAYIFSQLVTPIVNGVAQPLTDMISFDIGDDVTFAPGQVGSISYLPIIYMGGTIRNTVDLILKGSFDLKAFGVDIADLSIGPIVEVSKSADLGSINVYDKSFSASFGMVNWAPITMDFAGCQGATYGEFNQHMICGSSGFVQTGTDPAPGGLFVDLLDAFACDPRRQSGPVVCNDIPLGLESGPYFKIGPNKVYMNDSGYFQFAGITPPPNSSDADQNAVLDGLGRFSPSRFTIPEGRSYDTFGAVPEPGTWAMMIFGFGLIGFALRRNKDLAVQFC